MEPGRSLFGRRRVPSQKADAHERPSGLPTSALAVVGKRLFDLQRRWKCAFQVTPEREHRKLTTSGRVLLFNESREKIAFIPVRAFSLLGQFVTYC